MKIVCTATVLFAWMSEQALGDSTFRPLKVDYHDIISHEGDLSEMMDELSQVGMVSVTNFPDSFKEAKTGVQAWTHACASKSSATKIHTFEDGTKRSTMATHTIPGPGGMQKILHGESSIPCDAFHQASSDFREEVDRVTRAFSSHMSAGLLSSEPLLKTQDGFPYKTVSDVVENGEHLEHFHSYQGSLAAKDKVESTIEWHTDQGLFLAFTPGVLTASTTEDKENQVLDETGGFFIELADGSKTEVLFDSHDDLVIMLGDGVNQYVNPGLHGRKLRAVPHALAAPTNDADTARVWYGRMVLPPASAIHPEHGVTFGDLRRLLIDASTSSEKDTDVLALGCSSGSSSFTHARQLEEASCEEGTLLCWHRCMSVEEHGVSDAICAEQNLDLWCTNPRGQLWDNSHGDWFPACLNSTSAPNATEYPRLPTYPRDENETCTDVAYQTFVETNAQQYEFHADLMEGGSLLWSVDGDNVDAMFIWNGLFGFTAFGFAGFPGGNAMHGAIIVMATPSDTYSPVTGFDFEQSAAVEEYIIDPTDKAFRHWMSPVTTMARSVPISNPSTYSVEETECFTAMSFNTPGIFNTTFNVSGTDRMIWGANGWDMFAGYHGNARGVIEVEWATGKVTLDEDREAIKNEQGGHDHEDNDHEDHDHGDHDHEDGDKDTGSSLVEEVESETSAAASSSVALCAALACVFGIASMI